jgi:hypothetical protein
MPVVSGLVYSVPWYRGALPAPRGPHCTLLSLSGLPSSLTQLPLPIRRRCPVYPWLAGRPSRCAAARSPWRRSFRTCARGWAGGWAGGRGGGGAGCRACGLERAQGRGYRPMDRDEELKGALSASAWDSRVPSAATRPTGGKRHSKAPPCPALPCPALPCPALPFPRRLAQQRKRRAAVPTERPLVPVPVANALHARRQVAAHFAVRGSQVGRRLPPA